MVAVNIKFYNMSKRFRLYNNNIITRRSVVKKRVRTLYDHYYYGFHVNRRGTFHGSLCNYSTINPPVKSSPTPR